MANNNSTSSENAKLKPGEKKPETDKQEQNTANDNSTNVNNQNLINIYFSEMFGKTWDGIFNALSYAERNPEVRESAASWILGKYQCIRTPIKRITLLSRILEWGITDEKQNIYIVASLKTAYSEIFKIDPEIFKKKLEKDQDPLTKAIFQAAETLISENAVTEKLRKEKKDLQAKNETLRKENEKLQTQNKDLSEENEKLRKENEKLRREKKKSDEECEGAKQRLVNALDKTDEKTLRYKERKGVCREIAEVIQEAEYAKTDTDKLDIYRTNLKSLLKKKDVSPIYSDNNEKHAYRAETDNLTDITLELSEGSPVIVEKNGFYIKNNGRQDVLLKAEVSPVGNPVKESDKQSVTKKEKNEHGRN